MFSVLCIVRALDYESRTKESNDKDLSLPALAQQNLSIPRLNSQDSALTGEDVGEIPAGQTMMNVVRTI